MLFYPLGKRYLNPRELPQKCGLSHSSVHFKVQEGTKGTAASWKTPNWTFPWNENSEKGGCGGKIRVGKKKRIWDFQQWKKNHKLNSNTTAILTICAQLGLGEGVLQPTEDWVHF